MRIFLGLERSRMVAAVLQSPVQCAVIAFEVSSGAELRFLARTSENRFPNVSSGTAARCTCRAPVCEPLCKMLSCSWESLRRGETRRTAAIGELRELLGLRDEWWGKSGL